ncbi:MAG: hypothetical protein UD936_05075 [Acutalibacteraceae bacterium]|nr:hypothetical protein [Acutalibacteraceae bacterium]
MKRLTTDCPKTNTEVLLNYAQARDRRVVLLYANGRTNVDLYEHIAELANKKGCHCTVDDLRKGCCLGIDCDEDCEVAILNTVATQAAELRARLKYYEDKEEAKE